MKLGMTGFGGFSRKLFATLLVSAMMLTGSNAADNSIYVDQAGDSTTVSITQDGAGNAVRGLPGAGTGNTTPAKIYGDGNQVSVSQIGSGNTLKMGITTTTAAGAQNAANIIYNVTGNYASAIINSNGDGQGTSASNSISIDQSGNYASATVNVLGSTNQMSILTSGGANNSVTATQNGDNNNTIVSNTGGAGNSTTTDQQGNIGSINITSSGATNTVSVSQSGGSVNGHQATVDITGSGNGINIVQQGTLGDNVANIKSVGNTNTFTINQHNR